MDKLITCRKQPERAVFFLPKFSTQRDSTKQGIVYNHIMKKKPSKNKLRYGCTKCKVRFNSWQARDAHISISHPTPPPPRKEEKKFVRTNEYHRLSDAKQTIKLGDKILLTKEIVVTQVTLSEGSNTAEILASVISDSWGHK